MNPNNITQKDVYAGVALALSKFSDEFPENTATLRVDAVLAPGGGTATAANQVTEIGLLTTIATNTGTPPAGGATSANQTNGTQKTQIVNGANTLVVNPDGSINTTSSFTPSGTQDVNITKVAGVAVSQGHGTAATAIRVELPTDGTGVVGLNAGTNVIGHVINDAGSTTVVTGNVTVIQPTGTNLHTVLDSGVLTSITNALPTGTNLLGKVGIDQTTPGTTNGVVVNSSALPTGAATSANQATEIASLASIDAGIPAALGQTTMANSMPVTIASNQTAIPVTATLPSGTQTITSASVTGTTGSPIASGASSVGFTTSSDFTGTINGVTRSASTFYGFEATVGKTLPSIAYNATAGSIIIDSIV